MGWRYQIPALVDLGFRVVAPDMMGYGGTVSFPFKSRIFSLGGCIYTGMRSWQVIERHCSQWVDNVPRDNICHIADHRGDSC